MQYLIIISGNKNFNMNIIQVWSIGYNKKIMCAQQKDEKGN